MTFTHPLVLLLLTIPALLLASVPYRGVGLVLPFDHQPHPRRRFMTLVLGALDCAPALLLASAIFLIAGPQILKQPKNARELSNIQFCLDVSGSMNAEDRYTIAKEAIENFLKVREGDAFGLTLFGSEQIRWTPLTKDLNAVRNALPFGNPQRQPLHMGGTRIGAALRFCRDNMMSEAERGDRMIILVSDGASSDLGNGSGGEESDITEELRTAGITVYHIHVASDPIPEEVMTIASGTGGEAFQATDRASINRVFAHIDRMRPAKFNPAGTVPMDHFAPFALAALACLAFHLIGLAGLRYTPW
ncbi:MAG: VWA domain-containing protein [Phycisphaerae bacterium]|nr:VWA domain-containing protein [Phycisphaerae bacterium]